MGLSNERSGKATVYSFGHTRCRWILSIAAVMFGIVALCEAVWSHGSRFLRFFFADHMSSSDLAWVTVTYQGLCILFALWFVGMVRMYAWNAVVRVRVFAAPTRFELHYLWLRRPSVIKGSQLVGADLVPGSGWVPRIPGEVAILLKVDHDREYRTVNCSGLSRPAYRDDFAEFYSDAKRFMKNRLVDKEARWVSPPPSSERQPRRGTFIPKAVSVSGLIVAIVLIFFMIPFFDCASLWLNRFMPAFLAVIVAGAAYGIGVGFLVKVFYAAPLLKTNDRFIQKLRQDENN